MSDNRKMGCCTDKSCTAETCMVLPDGESCATCVHTVRCCTIFGHKPEDTYCDFFPRRFHKRAEDNPFAPEAIQKTLDAANKARAERNKTSES